MNKFLKRIVCMGTAAVLSAASLTPMVYADTNVNIDSIQEEFSGSLKNNEDAWTYPGSNGFDTSDNPADPSLVSAASSPAVISTICDYIEENGTETKGFGKGINLYTSEALIGIDYDKAKEVLKFRFMLNDKTLGNAMINFDYNILSESVDSNIGYFIMKGPITGQIFIAVTPFSTSYRDNEKMSAAVVKGRDLTVDQVEQVLPTAFSAGMKIWNYMIEKATNGKYNIGNLGFINYIAPKGDSGTANKSGFSDVSDNAYYSEPVIWAVNHKITSGTSATTFGPGNPCTRGQIVTFLYHAYGNGEISPASSFSDVSPNAYYYQAVNWAVAKGITSGTGNGRFSPNAPCTRGQAMTFLYKAKQAPAVQAGAIHFTDVSPNQYFYDAVNWAVSNHITSGTSRTTFSPNDVCNRAQIVTFLYRAN